jgi:hypothetical protein
MVQEMTRIDPCKINLLLTLGKQSSCPCPAPSRKGRYLDDAGTEYQDSAETLAPQVARMDLVLGLAVPRLPLAAEDPANVC